MEIKIKYKILYKDRFFLNEYNKDKDGYWKPVKELCKFKGSDYYNKESVWQACLALEAEFPQYEFKYIIEYYGQGIEYARKIILHKVSIYNMHMFWSIKLKRRI